MHTRDDTTDAFYRFLGLDPEYHASEAGRRKYGDGYGRSQALLQTAAASGGKLTLKTPAGVFDISEHRTEMEGE